MRILKEKATKKDQKEGGKRRAERTFPTLSNSFARRGRSRRDESRKGRAEVLNGREGREDKLLVVVRKGTYVTLNGALMMTKRRERTGMKRKGRRVHFAKRMKQAASNHTTNGTPREDGRGENGGKRFFLFTMKSRER